MVSDRKKNTQESDLQSLRAELEAAKKAEKRLLDFAELASDWFWETDTDHRFTDHFGEALERSGYASEYYVGELRTVGINVNLEPEKWRKHFDDLEHHRPFRDFIVQRTSRDGEERWAKVSGRPFYAADETFKGYRGTGTDITEQIKAQHQANDLNDLLQDAVNSIPEGFILFDENDHLVTCNESYRQSHAYLDRFLEPGTPFYDFALGIAKSGKIIGSRKDVEKWLDNRIQQHQNPGEPFVVSYEDGTSTLVSEFKTRLGGTAIIRSDITYQKEIENNLRKLTRALEQSPNAVFITDLNGIIEYINPKFTHLTGYTSEEALGQNPRILKSPNTSRELFSDLWRTIRRGDEWKSEIKDQRKDGSHFWAYETIAPVKDEIGNITHYVATHEDITERKDAELVVQAALKKTEIASRAKSDLMANMSHELRTPLNAIIGFSEIMKQETFGPVGGYKNQEYLDDIFNSGKHLLKLINDILDTSAIEADALELQEENVNLSDIIVVSVRLIMPRAEAGQVAVNSSINPEIPLLYADERRVEQILLNLLSNAVKFTPEGGEVCVSVQLNDDGSMGVSIADTGMGMDEEEVTLAMSTFGQVDSGLDRKHEGTGLGLPMTKGLIELHGGTLEVKSKKGKGTSVTVVFPKERVVQNV